mmetsp:Transcript_6806/g.25424  ORF Transcript_6806/g.25424 Transcript_6806/m.25424 type:complete len:114 (-) Transcript_6806:20-361(-)
MSSLRPTESDSNHPKPEFNKFPPPGYKNKGVNTPYFLKTPAKRKLSFIVRRRVKGVLDFFDKEKRELERYCVIVRKRLNRKHQRRRTRQNHRLYGEENVEGVRDLMEGRTRHH